MLFPIPWTKPRDISRQRKFSHSDFGHPRQRKFVHCSRAHKGTKLPCRPLPAGRICEMCEICAEIVEKVVRIPSAFFKEMKPNEN
eukprot:s127_g17.t1